MRHDTLIFLLQENQILLAMKKRGFGAGRWNGAGGKVEPGETIQAAVIRECQEEIGVTPLHPKKVARLTFRLPGRTIQAHTYLAEAWEGIPTESEEMRPRWFSKDAIPYHEMWQDDKHWLPHVLSGKLLMAEFGFDQDDRMISKHISLDVTAGDLHYEL